MDDAAVARNVERIALPAVVLSLAVVVALLAVPLDAARDSGVVGAAGAVAVFGASSIPAKHPAVGAADPALFQAFVTLGNCAATLACALLEARRRSELGRLAPTRWGVVGAALLTATQRCAWPAIRRLGAAVGPGVWCGVGMATSFAWGVGVFGEEPREPLASLGVAALVVGVAGVAAAQVAADAAATRAGEAGVELVAAPDGDDVGLVAEEAPPDVAPSAGVAGGLGLALLTGLCDGSLMAPFRAFEAAGPAAATSYLVSFAAALPVVAVPAAAAAWRRGGAASTDAKRAGVACGALWAVGNFCSVHATAGLGQAVGFPLTQVCVLVSAMFGILFFGELADARARALFVAAAATVLAGAACLGAGQRPPR